MLLLKLIHAWPRPGTKSLCQKFSRSRQFLTLGASEFKHIWADGGKAAEIYNNHPLATMDPVRRSMLLEDWARMMLEEKEANCEIQDPVPGKRIDGTRRGLYHAEYDFLSNERRVEIKSSQLKWDGNETWNVSFGGVKFGAFDDLYLVIFSPQWLDLIKHDLTIGISMSGPFSQSSGSGIKICGKAQWPEALDTILAKLCEGGNSLHVGRASIDDSAIKTLCDRHAGYTHQFYHEVPLALMNPTVRGLRVQKIVMEADRRFIHANSTFAEPGPEYAIDGKRRGKGNASYDWIRDEKRIEVKHSQLSFVENRRYWYCTFYGVKRTCFDELLLVIYSPRGLDIFKHDGSYALRKSGASEEISLRAGTRAWDWLSALQAIEAKLESNGCPRIAQILWDS